MLQSYVQSRVHDLPTVNVCVDFDPLPLMLSFTAGCGAGAGVCTTGAGAGVGAGILAALEVCVGVVFFAVVTGACVGWAGAEVSVATLEVLSEVATVAAGV